MSPPFVQTSSDQQAILAYCTAAKAIRDASKANAGLKKELRLKQKTLRVEVLEALRRSNSYVELRLPDGVVGYVHLTTRKGAQARITPASFGHAIRCLTADDIKSDPSTRGIMSVALEHMRGPGKDDVVITRSIPNQVQIARIPTASSTASQFQQSRHDLRQLSMLEREQCTTHRERCARTEAQVVTHLQRHDPKTLQQQVRMKQAGNDVAYVLKAKSKVTRLTRKETAQEAEYVLQRAMPMTLSPAAILAHLQLDETLSQMDSDLRQRFEILKTSERCGAMAVSLTPVK